MKLAIKKMNLKDNCQHLRGGYLKINDDANLAIY